MQYSKLFMIVVLILAGLQLSACAQGSTAKASKSEPAKVEHIEGSDLSRVILTEDAARRLDIQTAQVRDEQVNGTQSKVIPYAAVLYDPQGSTWAYVNTDSLTYMRQSISVDRIEGDLAILSDGPAAGTAVVTVGAAELFGTESGVGGH